MCYSCVMSLCPSKVSPAIYSKMKKAGSPISAVYFPPLLYSFIAFLYVIHVRSVIGISIPSPLLVFYLEIFSIEQDKKKAPRALRIFICAFLTT